jgi:FeS assembly protein IscX
MGDHLSWENTYPIALALAKAHPGVELVDVSLNMILEWTLALPDFDDDPLMVNDDVLTAIFQEWYEEVNPI